MGLLGFVGDFTNTWRHRNKVIILFLTFGVPLVITLLGKNLFLKAVGFGAGIGAVIIFEYANPYEMENKQHQS